MMYRIIGILILSITIINSAFSQIFDDGTEDLEALYGDEEWIAISTGTKKPIYKAPAVANVITKDDIKRLGATTLDEILESVPGMHVGFSTLRAESIYTIRGFGSTLFNSQVLTLINGTPIDTALNGGRPNAFRMPVANIERIEIIRGPGSAIYGADAYAGVINIITKDAASSPGTQTGVRYGSFGTQNFWLAHGTQLGSWDTYLGIDHQKTDGDDNRIIETDLQSQLDALFGTAASLSPSALDSEYEVTDFRLELSKGNWQFRLSNLDISDVGQAAGVAQALDHTGKTNSTLLTSDATYHNNQSIKHWDFKIAASYTKMKGEPDFQILPPGSTVPIGADGNLFTAPSQNCPLIGGAPLCFVTFTEGVLGNPDMEETHYRIEVISIYDRIDKHRIRLSAGFSSQELEASETKNFGPSVIDGTIPIINGSLTDVTNTDGIYLTNSGQDRTNTFLSLQDEWAISNDWEFTLGIRYDDYSDFGSAVNPRLALVWQTNYNLTSKILYGKAFRAPSFIEQFGQSNPVSLGNPNIDPETIDTFELVFDYRPTLDSQIIFNTFQYDADDLILFVPDLTGASTAQNSGGQKGHGFEIEANYKFNKDAKIYANYSWISAEDKLTNNDIADIPSKQFYLNGSWQFKSKWTFSTQLNWVAGRERAATDPRSKIDDYTTVDFIIKFDSIVEKLDLSASVRNAFDEDARDPSPGPIFSIENDFPLAGRSYFIQLVRTF